MRSFAPSTPQEKRNPPPPSASRSGPNDAIISPTFVRVRYAFTGHLPSMFRGLCRPALRNSTERLPEWRAAAASRILRADAVTVAISTCRVLPYARAHSGPAFGRRGHSRILRGPQQRRESGQSIAAIVGLDAPFCVVSFFSQPRVHSRRCPAENSPVGLAAGPAHLSNVVGEREPNALASVGAQQFEDESPTLACPRLTLVRHILARRSQRPAAAGRRRDVKFEK